MPINQFQLCFTSQESRQFQYTSGCFHLQTQNNKIQKTKKATLKICNKNQKQSEHMTLFMFSESKNNWPSLFPLILYFPIDRRKFDSFCVYIFINFNTINFPCFCADEGAFSFQLPSHNMKITHIKYFISISRYNWFETLWNINHFYVLLDRFNHKSRLFLRSFFFISANW